MTKTILLARADEREPIITDLRAENARRRDRVQHRMQRRATLKAMQREHERKERVALAIAAAITLAFYVGLVAPQLAIDVSMW